MKFHLATVNTAQLVRQFNQIYSAEFLPSQPWRQVFGALPCTSNRENYSSVAICSQQAGPDKMVSPMTCRIPNQLVRCLATKCKHKKCTNQPSECMKNSFPKVCCKNSALSLWNRKKRAKVGSSPSPSAPRGARSRSRWYYFSMTEPICYNYQGLSALSPWITIVSGGLALFSHSDANL